MDACLDRDAFRQRCLNRDGHKCVVCQEQSNLAVHHIIERRLFPDGGYYIENGSTLCQKHHIEAEQTVLSCDELRNLCNIQNVCLPPHLYKDHQYDKWGNVILPDGRRSPGELFDDASVQKILQQGNVLSAFTKYIKYPRTFHLPWSPGKTKDDKTLESCDHFIGKQVVVTLKLDGENSSCYSDYMHARSLSGQSHISQSWIKNLHATKKFDIPDGWRVCGENVFAKHSIHYKNLADYFYVFSVWNSANMCLSWKETKEWCELIGFVHVPVLYEGLWDELLIKEIHKPTLNGDDCEGYVVRLASEFHYGQFRRSVAKYVRAGHVTSSHNWRFEPMIKNAVKQR